MKQWLDRVQQKMGEDFRYALEDTIDIFLKIVCWLTVSLCFLSGVSICLDALTDETPLLLLWWIPLIILSFPPTFLLIYLDKRG